MKTKINKAQFTDEKGNKYSRTFYELQNEAEMMAMKQHYNDTDNEIDGQDWDYTLSYLYDCYLDCENVPEVDGECIYFFQWLDWLQYGFYY